LLIALPPIVTAFHLPKAHLAKVRKTTTGHHDAGRSVTRFECRECRLPTEKTGRTSMIDVAEGVRKVIAFHLGAVETGMTEDAKLTDLGVDSIDLYEVVMSLEENFNITINDRDAQSFVTLGDTITFIKGKIS
jgi:acyl carrier protein